MTKIWDALQFCHIIDNVLFWSQHILMPKLSLYIDQWKIRYCPEVNSRYTRLEQDLETAGLNQRIQDRLSSLNILPTFNISELIQQAVIFQEVTRSSSSGIESRQNRTNPVSENGRAGPRKEGLESSMHARIVRVSRRTV